LILPVATLESKRESSIDAAFVAVEVFRKSGNQSHQIAAQTTEVEASTGEKEGGKR